MLRAVRIIPPAFCLLVLAVPVQATTFTVTKTADTFDGACDYDCSLREAVSASNAVAGVDVVEVPEGIYTLSRTGAGEDANAAGDLDVTDELLLVGAGPGTTVLDGFGSDRVLDMHAPGEIYGVTIRNGRVNGDGGGLFVRQGSPSRPVILRRGIVFGNQALGGGGGMAVFGILEVRESAILNNNAEGDGGGLKAGDHGIFFLTNVTVSHNIAQGSGGGLYYLGDTTSRISASTIVNNQAGVSGGGIYARVPFSAGDGPPQLLGSIIAINTAPADTDCFGAGSLGYNVFGDPGSRTHCALDPSDRVQLPNEAWAVGDAYHGFFGPTPVHVITPGGHADDLVPAAFCEPADQVGQARSAPCDAGAWERVIENPVCVPGGTVLCLQDGRFRLTIRWRTEPHARGEFAQAVPLTDDTGNFWFFAPENLEVMVKVLNGCGLNQRWWVFASGLTDVGFDLEVWDLRTFRIWFDHHEPGKTYPPRLDTNAFDCALPARSAAAEGVPAGPASPAAVLLVTKTADTDDGSCDHDCSLREAVLRANLQETASVIVLGPGVYTLGVPGEGEDEGHTGDLDQTGYLVILGAGADRTAVDGAGLDRVFDAQGYLELHGVTVRGGLSRAEGGGIRSFSVLALIRSTVRSNRADHEGGGIAALDFIGRDSTISGNFAGTSGGGISADTANLENVTLSGNQAGDMGGGASFSDFATELRNVTITGNSARLGGGLAVETTCPNILCPPNHFEMERTVIAGNTVTGYAASADCDAVGHSGTHNLFGIAGGCGPAGGDLAGTLAQPLDPRLTPLGDHGGPTFTHALLPDSPAIDLAPAASCPGADQRGRPRPADGDQDGAALCDAGAVERLPACQPDEETLCLGEGDRFQITARWTAQGTTGPGKAVPLAAFAGSFWFFDAANLEITVKVLDGCGLNDRFWVFLSGLTDVGVEVTVEDTATGSTWTHNHAAGTPLQPRLDTNALNCANL
ncbi:MAG TPA: CSLREA domain-containing protein [Thermoanaerobaculia bacterium]|nr:CSLREA domain-containing protein [Thermoanaerobaculia bacterium]